MKKITPLRFYMNHFADPSLIKKYLESLPQKLSLFKIMIDELDTHRSLPYLKTLYQFVHQQAGTTGTYGLIQTSQLYQKLNQILSLRMDSFGVVDQLFINELNKYYTMIQQSIIHESSLL